MLKFIFDNWMLFAVALASGSMLMWPVIQGATMVGLNPAGAEDGLVGRWGFEGSLSDSSGNSNNGTAMGAAAIGTGRTASPEQAQQMHASIRGWLNANSGSEIAAGLRILYGGSVKPENISELMNCEDIDGALVGGASLDAESFARIVNYRQ